MVNENMFGDENSPLRESPQFRRYMEEYKVIDSQIKVLQENRGYLSYEKVIELGKLKKLKLSTRDQMEKWRNKVLSDG